MRGAAILPATPDPGPRQAARLTAGPRYPESGAVDASTTCPGFRIAGVGGQGA